MLDFKEIIENIKFEEAKTDAGADGYGKNRLTLCLILQFLEDLSDREMERYMRENLAGKWFADFGISEETPTYSTFCKFRNMIGTKNMGNLFESVNAQIKQKGMMREVFTFVDSSALISKLTTWEERDRAIKNGETTFNNEIAKKEEISSRQTGTIW